MERLELYSLEDLKTIIKRTAGILNVGIDEESIEEIARRSRGTPRIANRLVKRIRDYATVVGDGKIDISIAKLGLDKLEIDRKILDVMINKYGGKPIGIETLATTVGEDIDTIEDVYEPYLIQIGFIARTPRGRVPLPDAYDHIGAEHQIRI